jgi:hypothetical protein
MVSWSMELLVLIVQLVALLSSVLLNLTKDYQPYWHVNSGVGDSRAFTRTRSTQLREEMATHGWPRTWRGGSSITIVTCVVLSEWIQVYSTTNSIHLTRPR